MLIINIFYAFFLINCFVIRWDSLLSRQINAMSLFCAKSFFSNIFLKRVFILKFRINICKIYTKNMLYLNIDANNDNFRSTYSLSSKWFFFYFCVISSKRSSMRWNFKLFSTKICENLTRFFMFDSNFELWINDVYVVHTIQKIFNYFDLSELRD